MEMNENTSGLNNRLTFYTGKHLGRQVLAYFLSADDAHRLLASFAETGTKAYYDECAYEIDVWNYATGEWKKEGAE